MMEQFHFSEPLWLLALIPFLLLLRLDFYSAGHSKAWDKIIDPNLLPVLLQGKSTGSGRLSKILLAIGWLLGVIALADPVWEKIPRPIFQTNAARVLVLDLSNSMLVDDLKPNRLARAKFKVEDILSLDEEGQTGLVVFAGDAFTASPLTRDTETIRSLLKVLKPQLMPVQGSRVDLGLIKAHELFKQASITNGQVLMIADGMSKSTEAIDAAKDLRKDGHIVSVLGVGTEAGGELKFSNNQNVSVKLEADKLIEVAKQGGGKYHLISTNNSDVTQVLLTHKTGNDTSESTLQKQDEHREEWHSTGPIIVLLLLPLAALAFRRGWLLNIVFMLISGGVLLQPQPVLAFSLDELWISLSQNKEQQADSAFKDKQYEKASELSRKPLRRGAAEYKQGKFEEAIENFKQSDGADARYNQGNALAKLEKYEDAIKSYDEALSLNPEMNDAKDNKKAIEELLKRQQEKKQSESDNSQKNSDDKGKQNSEKGGEEGEGEGKKGEQQSDQGENSSKKKGSEGDEQQQGKNEESDEEGKQSEEDQSSKGKNQFSDANKALEDGKDSEQETGQETGQEAEQDSEKSAENAELNGDDKDAATQSNKENQQEMETGMEANEQQNAIKQERIEKADDLTKEEKMAAEQWLRRIPDDPGGLLRRKFRSQYQQRRRRSTGNSEQPW